MTIYGTTRPDGTIVPRDAEWSLATRDGISVAWNAETAPITHVWINGDAYTRSHWESIDTLETRGDE